MSALGLDIGNENCVIAAVKQQGIDVLLNDESKRETPAVVSFGEKQRFLGSAGAASATMNPRSTISQVKRLIGRRFTEPSLLNDLKFFPFETSEASDGGVLIHLQYMGEGFTFTPVQILAMIFSHLKQMAEKDLQSPVSDCVIGIPSYFTDLQRRQYLYAASISGLKPLRLMHDCTATALGYGIYKTSLTKSGATNVVFVDVGHCDTQVAIASFEPGGLKILSHAFDSNLGGRDFDEVLFCYFAAQFKETYNIDVYSNIRASIRLRAACEKLKKILSANAEAPLNIECLMDEKDVKGFIKRDEFESLASSLFERITVPCQKALDSAGLSVDQLHLVELVGSGSRIPAIVRVLSSFFRREPSRTLNASECISRGCALQCAMLSPMFRVREYEVQDSLPFSIGLSSDEGPIETLPHGVLFPRGHPIPSVKMISLHKSSNFSVEAFYADRDELPPGVSPKISIFNIAPFQTSSNNANYGKIKVTVQLNLHGIITLDSAMLIEDQIDDHSSNDMPSEKMEDGSLASGNGIEDRRSSPSKPVSSASSNRTYKGRASKRQEIPVTETVHGGMTEVELFKASEKEFQLTQQDIRVEQAKDKKNTLESYVYETRSKILSTYRSFASVSEKEGISQHLQQTEEWLYDEGDDETEDVYVEKLERLKMLVDPVEHRYKDEEARAQAKRELYDCIAGHRSTSGSLAAKEKNAVLTECEKAEQWLREKSLKQDSLPKYEEPILWSTEIRRKTDALNAMCKHIVRSEGHPHNADQRHNKGDDDMEID